MSKFENEQEKKVREIILKVLDENSNCLADEVDDQIKKEISEEIMLRIRPYLKVQKKWMGDAL